MDDPVSWLLIRPGWKVYAADGTDVGAVDEIAGDDGQDVFDGLAVARTALGKPVYVPAEQVGTITEGAMRCSSAIVCGIIGSNSAPDRWKPPITA